MAYILRMASRTSRTLVLYIHRLLCYPQPLLVLRIYTKERVFVVRREVICNLHSSGWTSMTIRLARIACPAG